MSGCLLVVDVGKGKERMYIRGWAIGNGLAFCFAVFGGDGVVSGHFGV